MDISKNKQLDSLDGEVWRNIPGFIGLYKVSNLGRVKSLRRFKNRIGTTGIWIKERIISQSIHSTGYFKVGIRDFNGNKFYPKTHQLVAMAFLGYVRDGNNKIVVDHIDNNPLNNNLNNLQIITNRENASKDKNNGSSKYTGVSWCKRAKKWRAGIYINGKSIYIGMFDNEIDAANAYINKLNNN